MTPVSQPEIQPLLVNVGQLVEAMAFLGAPFSPEERRRLSRAAGLAGDGEIGREVQAVLDQHCLLMVQINPESRVRVEEGSAARELVQGAWLPFLVKIHNEAGWTGPLGVASPQSGPVFDKEYCEVPAAPGGETGVAALPRLSPAAVPPDPAAAQAQIRDRWLDLELFRQRPMNPGLSGARLEYAILCLRSRDAGRRSAVLSFDAGQGTQDIGFRGELALTFVNTPATEVTLRVRDESGRPAIGAFLILDAQSRVHPSPFKRLAPDFFFQPQVYRGDGESVLLAPGSYMIEFSRGPESLKELRKVLIGAGPQTLAFQARRWIDPAAFGYQSGDHHIHGAGCAHYTTPSLGVNPADIARQIQGEDLKVGGVLTWGPGFDFQKNFFTGREDAASSAGHVLRYDIEVSGFGSYRTGHLCLLRLKEGNYPGGDSTGHWPSLGLNILRWAKRQGAVCGSPHSGGGLQLAGDGKNSELVLGTDIPFHEIPAFDGTGAVEYLVNITHEVPGPDGRLVPALDFISMCDTPFVSELTMWYHTLNCGFRPRAAGETDFPCLSGDRVGIGRSYVRTDGALTYDNWCQGLADGRGYVSEGGSHLIDFMIGDTLVGAGESEVRLERPGTAKVRVKAAALLEESAREENPAWEIDRSQTELTLPPTGLTSVRRPAYATRVYPHFWHIERARLGGSRKVAVELILNGESVGRREIVADGRLSDVEFEVLVRHSSWAAVRILGSSHSNPIFILVGGKPIRASRRSAQWCLKGVDAVWERKERFYEESEKAGARAAYDHARAAYRRIAKEAVAE